MQGVKDQDDEDADSEPFGSRKTSPWEENVNEVPAKRKCNKWRCNRALDLCLNSLNIFERENEKRLQVMMVMLTLMIILKIIFCWLKSHLFVPFSSFSSRISMQFMFFFGKASSLHSSYLWFSLFFPQKCVIQFSF